MPDSNRIDEFTNRPELRRKRERMLMLQRLWIALFVLYCISSMTLLLVLGYQSQDQRGRIISCTTPTGKCYKEGQKNTAKAIEYLIQSDRATRSLIITAVACGQNIDNHTQEDILRCVREKEASE